MNNFKLFSLKTIVYSASLFAFFFHSSEAGLNEMSASLSVEMEVIQPSDFPILIKMTVTNTGNVPICYQAVTSGNYPGTHNIRAILTDSNKASRIVNISNGPVYTGSGITNKVSPGSNIIIPAVVEPLSVGSYEIKLEIDSFNYSKSRGRVCNWPAISNEKGIKFSVKKGTNLEKNLERRLLSMIRKGDLFAKYVVATYKDKMKYIISKLINDLKSDDINIAYHAAHTLSYSKTSMSNEHVKYLETSMKKHMNLPNQSYENVHKSLLISLVHMLADIGTEEAMVPILNLAKSNNKNDIREWAIDSLARFHKEAPVELIALLSDKDERIRFVTARKLAYLGSPQAMNVLLEIAQNKNSAFRNKAFHPLSEFIDSPKVEEVLRNSMDYSAKIALGDLLYKRDKRKYIKISNKNINEKLEHWRLRDYTLMDDLEQGLSIVVGEIQRVDETKGSYTIFYTYRVKINEVIIEGDLDSVDIKNQIISIFGGSYCGHTLVPGHSYILYIERDIEYGYGWRHTTYSVLVTGEEGKKIIKKFSDQAKRVYEGTDIKIFREEVMDADVELPELSDSLVRACLMFKIKTNKKDRNTYAMQIAQSELGSRLDTSNPISSVMNYLPPELPLTKNQVIRLLGQPSLKVGRDYFYYCGKNDKPENEKLLYGWLLIGFDFNKSSKVQLLKYLYVGREIDLD